MLDRIHIASSVTSSPNGQASSVIDARPGDKITTFYNGWTFNDSAWRRSMDEFHAGLAARISAAKQAASIKLSDQQFDAEHERNEGWSAER